ncbi:MAG: hypothetical protein QXX51_08445 [Candidatus Bathyarchaeia archaeon]
MSIELLIASELVSAGLALIIVCFLFRVYKFTRYLYLLGLLIGFSLLAASYILLGMFLFYENNAVISEQFLWARLIVQGFGYAFIAFAYYFSRKSEKATRFYFVLISLFCAISIGLFFAALIVAPPFLELPSVMVADECFRVANLTFLGYVIYRVVKHFDFSHEVISGLKWTVLAFSMLWLAQYSMLIWGIDGSQTAFVLAHVARLASLTLFIFIYRSSGKEEVGSESREA